MGDWRRKTIGDLVTLQRGIDLPDAERKPGSVPIMGSFGITGRHNESACKGPGVTVGRSGASAGVVCYIDEDFWPLNTCLYVRDFKGNHPRFAYYLLKTFDLARLNSGSAQPSLNRNFVHPVPATFPDPPEQNAIASVLGALDDKIELNRRMNETLEAMARAIFKDWFVDFGPTRAKMEGRAPYLAPEIWSLFPDRLDEEGRPLGWALTTLGEITSELRRGLSPSYIEREGVRVINQKCIRNQQVNFIFSRRHDSRKRSIGGRDLVPGDILVNSTGIGTLGRVAQIWEIDEPTVIDSHVTMVRAARDMASPYYLGLNLSRREDEIERLGEGSTGQTELSRIRLSSLPVLLPTRPAQLAFENSVSTLVERQIANIAESRTLAATRDLLLPKLMSGEIRVKDAEEIASEVL